MNLVSKHKSSFPLFYEGIMLWKKEFRQGLWKNFSQIEGNSAIFRALQNGLLSWLEKIAQHRLCNYMHYKLTLFSFCDFFLVNCPLILPFSAIDALFSFSFKFLYVFFWLRLSFVLYYM